MIGDKTHSEITVLRYNTDMKQELAQRKVTKEEVDGIIKRLKSSSSCGNNSIAVCSDVKSAIILIEALFRNQA